MVPRGWQSFAVVQTDEAVYLSWCLGIGWLGRTARDRCVDIQHRRAAGGRAPLGSLVWHYRVGQSIRQHFATLSSIRLRDHAGKRGAAPREALKCSVGKPASVTDGALLEKSVWEAAYWKQWGLTNWFFYSNEQLQPGLRMNS